LATPSSCLRCQKPLAVDATNGLCVTCSQAIETERRTATPQVPGSVSGTARQIEDQGTATRTGQFDATADTKQWDGKARNRATPSGFELLRYLGGGGMGDVYLALEYAADRRVAMKFLRAAADPRSAWRFVKEIRALAKLEHPNIIRVIAVDLDRSDPFFTMEYAAGGTLTERVKAEGLMEPEDAAQLFVRLARAVHAAHSEQILHRDIKPGNIVLAEDGTPKLSDFGLAKRMDEELDTKTHASVAVGTPPYMPPEAVTRKHGDFCEASDVYGLGATLFFALTGRAPFSGDYNEVMRQVERDAPPRPRSIRPEIPLGLEAIVLKCLEKRPADRYSSAEELANDLERYLEGAKPVAPPMTRPRRVKQWARRNRVGVAIGALLGTVIVSLASLRPWEERDPAEAIRNELSQGRTVQLLGESGTPRYHRWALGSATFGQATNGSPACYYETMGMGLLELCPAPGIDRYRITLDILQLEAHAGDPPGKPQGLRYLGPYFGYSSATTADGRLVHWYFATTFSDIRPNGENTLDTNRDPKPHRSNLGKAVEFPGAGGTAGLWRNFRIDIAPELVEISWKREDEQEFQPLLALVPPGIQSGYAEPQPLLEKNESTTLTAPKWSANSPFGIWTQRTGVCIRNIRIIPGPKPL
jgi:serine/threonine protein kinase